VARVLTTHKAMHYKASYTRKANTLNVRRELLIQRAQRFCMPSEEKDWLALTEVMKQELRGRFFCGELFARAFT